MSTVNLTVSWDEEGVTQERDGFETLGAAMALAIAMSNLHMYAYVNGTVYDGLDVSLTYQFGENVGDTGKKPSIGPAQQDWALNIPIMQQSVLFAAVRAPDGIRKNHPVKVLLRWYRRCVLLSAFDQRALLDPFEEGGGSFTGPFTHLHADAFCFGLVPWLHGGHYQLEERWATDRWEYFDHMRRVYLEHVDELPHHFQLHFMHAAQIVGAHHSHQPIREWWWTFYLMIVDDAHLHPETVEEMSRRLSDDRDEWKAREEVTAA